MIGNLTRRDVLCGGAVAAAASLGLLAGCAPANPKTAQTGDASGDAAPSEIGLEQSLSSADATLEVDVLVAGSGAAGVSAAVEAAQQGLTVALAEASSEYGGSTAMAEGILGMNTPYQKARGIVNEVDEAVKQELEASGYLANIYLLKSFLGNADDNIAWLEENGVSFMPEPNTLNPLNTYQHFYNGQGKAMVAAMVASAEALGATLLPSTRVKRVIMEGDAVAGAVVEGKEGEYVIKCGALILATGGFLQNDELFDENFPYASARIKSGGAPYHEGDGYLIAQSAGSDQHGICCPGWVWAALESFDVHSELSTAACNEPYLWVNEAGERFVNEDLLIKFSTVCNAILSQKRVFSILSQTEVDRLMSEGCSVGWGSYILTGAPLSDLQNQLDEAKSSKPAGFFYGETLDDLAKAIAVDPAVLRETVQKYNAAVQAGVDEEFNKNEMYLREVPGQDAFYAFELMAHATNLTGGVVINPQCEVIKEDGSVIPGLYGTGCDASGLTGFTYFSTLGGSKQMFSVDTGRTAARSAAALLG